MSAEDGNKIMDFVLGRIEQNAPKKWWLISDEDVQKIRDGLMASTHEANDFNCEDWPDRECRGCVGQRIREAGIYALNTGLHETDVVPDDWKPAPPDHEDDTGREDGEKKEAT